MSVCFEYYQGRLQVHVWGEKSLKNGGDIDATVIITDDYPRFCQEIESSHFYRVSASQRLLTARF